MRLRVPEVHCITLHHNIISEVLHSRHNIQVCGQAMWLLLQAGAGADSLKKLLAIFACTLYNTAERADTGSCQDFSLVGRSSSACCHAAAGLGKSQGRWTKHLTAEYCTGPQRGRLSGLGIRTLVGPHVRPASSETAQ